MGENVFQIAESGTTIEYPITDDELTFVLWKAMNPHFAQMISSFEENICLDYIQEQTGVNLDFIEPSEQTSSEQFNLMIASGDYPDLMDCTGYSGGGLSACYADEVIYELTDLIAEHAPDYWAAVENSNDATMRSLKDDEGNMLCVYTINNVYFVERGLETRNDWLEELGLPIPKTVDQLYETMLAFKAEYNTPKTFNIDANGVIDYVVGAWGISGLNSYLEDGKVVSSLTNPALKDYTTFIHNMYVDGLIDPEFYNSPMGPNSNAVNDLTGFWFGMADAFSSDKAMAKDPDFDAIGIGAITMNEGDTYHFGDLPTMTGRANLSISTCCEEPEKCMEFINWFFTSDGYMVANYGMEGESFTYNEDGEPVYTDLIANNPDGFNKVNAKVVYAFWNIIPFYNAQDALLYTFEGREVESIEVWTNMEYDQKLPTLSYTVDESAEYSNLSTEISTYVEQEFLKFVVGDLEINDENWNAFVDQIKAMGIDRQVEMEQVAYERYLAR
ncbi:MAG: extracellular solute-binding protein [Ruminococcaceae bacterium]|nr:extracellular solute-binding protein [Oscillospiraceae bacterium]